MVRLYMWCVLSALLLGSLSAGCGGGGGGSGRVEFVILSVSPDTSVDLNGGGRVAINGSNFNAFIGFTVTFGGQVGINPVAESDTLLRVTVPGAAVAGLVIVEVTGVDDEANTVVKQLVNAYRYVGGVPNPVIQQIAPVQFSPSGAEAFTITGTNLGPTGGTVNIQFAGIGTVRGTINAGSTAITGRAPVSIGLPPGGPIQVRLDPAGSNLPVPNTVTYVSAGPQSLIVPFQGNDGASRPVRVTEGIAAFCTRGADLVWQSADDEVWIVREVGGVITPMQVQRAGGGPVGNLDRQASVVVPLNADAFIVYTVGPNGAVDPNGVAGPDDGYIQISSLTGTPVVTDHTDPSNFLLMNAPIAGVGTNRIAFCTAGADAIRGTADDVLAVRTFTATAITGGAQIVVPFLDATNGAANSSIPFGGIGDVVYTVCVGANGTPRDGDDLLYGVAIPTSTVVGPAAFPFAQVNPIEVGLGVVAGTVLGADGATGGVGGNADGLRVGQVSGANITASTTVIGNGLDGGAVAAFARIGTGLAVATLGPDGTPASRDEIVQVFLDVTSTTFLSLAIEGTVAMAGLSGGGLSILDRGTDLAVNSPDDQSRFVTADASSSRAFRNNVAFPQLIAALTDSERVFTVTLGPDGAANTGDELIVIYQSGILDTAVIGQSADSTTLPAAGVQTPLSGQQPFVPIAAGWGLVQSPGPDALLNGGAGTDDRMIAVRY